VFNNDQSSGRQRQPFDRRAMLARRRASHELDALLGRLRRPDLDVTCPRVSLREAA
jgi:hypothetical protein